MKKQYPAVIQWFLSLNDLFFVCVLLLGLSPSRSQMIMFLLNLPLVCNYRLYCRIALWPNFPTETSHLIWSTWRPANVLLSTDEGDVRLRQAAELWAKDLRWSPGATDGRPVLPLQSLGTFLGTGYASGGCRAPLMHQQAQICKRTVNKHSVKAAIECVTARVGPHGPICAASWPRLFGLQVFTNTRGFNYRGQVCNVLVCFTHFCVFFHLFDQCDDTTSCKVVTDVCSSETQVLNVLCICITNIFSVFLCNFVDVQWFLNALSDK